MVIKILGTGCPKCKELEKRTMNAISELKINAEVEKVTDLKRIVEYNIFSTPALVINEKVKCYGKVPTVEEIKNWIKEELE